MAGTSMHPTAGKRTLTARVSYRDLPFKTSLIILMLARMAEPLSTAAIQSNMFFQLRHLSPHADASIISSQAGLLVGCRTAAHACTGLFWGRLADSKYGGRKPVLVIGLLACGIGTLGYGHSPSFAWALAWQLVDGLCNSSIPMVRCMVAELHPEKKYLARSLTLLPLSASFGLSLGPVLAGFLARDEQMCVIKKFTCRYPFSIPSIIIAGFCAVVATLVLVILQENPRSDFRLVSIEPDDPEAFTSNASVAHDIENSESMSAREREPLLRENRVTERPVGHKVATTTNAEVVNTVSNPEVPSVRQLKTNCVVYTMLATFLISGHLGTFSTLWPMFLSTPHHANGGGQHVTQLSGGLGINSRQVAACMSSLGLPSILLQVTIYPTLNDKYGAVVIWRCALLFFPVAYSIAPLATLAVHSWPGSREDSINMLILWGIISLVLVIFIIGRTGVNPATTMLINDCTPDPRLRGTVHTMGTIAANLGKSIFPAIILPIFGFGLRVGISGLGFWCLAVISVLACVLSRKVKEGGSPGDRS